MAGSVLIRFLGDASGVKKAAGETATAVGGVDRATTAATTSLTNYAQGLPGMGVAASAGFGKAQMAALGAAGGAAVAGAAIAKFALDGVGQFAALAGEIDNVQDVAGGTAEEASKLVAVARAVGTTSEDVASAVFKMSSNIRNNSEAFEENGVAIARNEQGGVDLIETVLNVGDAYRDAAAKGGDANKVLSDAFGRSGRQIIDILERSRGELEGFLATAEKSGSVLSDEDLAKAREYEVAMSELNQAMGEVQRAVGSALIPALTSLAETTTTVTDKISSLGIEARDVTNIILGAIPGYTQLQVVLDQLGISIDGTGSGMKTLGEHMADMGVAVGETAREVRDGWQELADYNREMNAFSEALDDGLDSLLDTRKAYRDNGEAIDALTIATRDGRKADESAADFKDRLSASLDDVVRSLRPVLDGLVTEGAVTDSVSGRTAWLVGQLEDLKGQYPQLAVEINHFIYTALQAAAKSGPIGYQIGVDFAANLQRGLVDGENRVVGSADSIAHHIEDTVNGRLNIPSPSAPSGVAVRAGQAVGSGLSRGMDDQKPEVQASADELAGVIEGLADDITSALDTIYGRGDAQEALKGAKDEIAALYTEKSQLPALLAEARQTNRRAQEALAKNPEDEGRRRRADETEARLRELQDAAATIDQRLADAQRDLRGAESRAISAEQGLSGLGVNAFGVPSFVADASSAVGSERALQLLGDILTALKDPRPVEVTVDGARLGKAIAEPVRTELIKIGKRNGGNVLAGQA